MLAVLAKPSQGDGVQVRVNPRRNALRQRPWRRRRDERPQPHVRDMRRELVQTIKDVCRIYRTRGGAEMK